MEAFYDQKLLANPYSSSLEAPQEITIHPLKNSLALMFEAVKSAETYHIYYSQNPFPNKSDISIVSSDVPQLIIPNLQGETIYYIAITSLMDGKESAFSNIYESQLRSDCQSQREFYLVSHYEFNHQYFEKSYNRLSNYLKGQSFQIEGNYVSEMLGLSKLLSLKDSLQFQKFEVDFPTHDEVYEDSITIRNHLVGDLSRSVFSS